MIQRWDDRSAAEGAGRLRIEGEGSGKRCGVVGWVRFLSVRPDVEKRKAICGRPGMEGREPPSILLKLPL